MGYCIYQVFKLGWEEWVGLPQLGLPALEAKVDTGARTSALHAFDIELFGPATKPKVRFLINPIPARPDLAIACSATIHDRRDVTSSNGDTEARYVILIPLEIGPLRQEIEITLTDRANMSYRMLLGRQAIGADWIITPSESFRQPHRSYEVYHTAAVKETAPKRALRIAVLSRKQNYTTHKLQAEGEARGHVVEVINKTRCYMALNAMKPAVYYDGQELPKYDAVIPRIGPSITAYGAAILRQFETLGVYCLNGSAAITASRDKLHAHQILSRHRTGMPQTAFAASPKDTNNLITLVGNAPLVVKLLESSQGKGVVLAETKKAAQSVIDAFRGLSANFLVQNLVKEAAGEDIRCLVINGKVVAAMKRVGAADDSRSNLHRGSTAVSVRINREERETAIRSTRAFGLGIAGVDMLRGADGPKVLEVNSSPGFEGIEEVTGKNIAAHLYSAIEKHVRPAPIKRRPPR